MVQLSVSTAVKTSPDQTLGTDLEMTAATTNTDDAKSERGSGKWDIVVPNPKLKKRPRLCFFVTSLLVVMIAAVVLILVIKISLTNRDESCCADANKTKNKDEEADELKLEKKSGLNLDISWEMKRAFLELRQIMGDFKPLMLFPIYRKDLPSDYIAYYEVKLQHKDGQSYAVISSGEETGDYSLVETGGVPSPLDELRDQAFTKGFYCTKFFRLTTDGVTICEDHRLNKVVASTGNIFPNQPVTDWKELDAQVSKLLPQVRTDWTRMAEVASKMKEWKVSGTSTVFDNSDDFQEGATERGLYPGEFTEIPIENITAVQIKFIGLSGHNTIENSINISLRLWQIKLCQVLSNICNPEKLTTIREDVVTSSFAGTKYLRFGVNNDKKYVKTTLDGQEVRFQVELNTASGKQIVLRYGIALAGKRLGRSVDHSSYEIPDEKSFPDIRFHGNCLGASTMLSAWTMVFSYYDNLATSRPELCPIKFMFKKNELGESFPTAKDKQNYIASVLAPKIDMKCTLFNPKKRHWNKNLLESWLQQKVGKSSKIVHVSGLYKRPKATRKAVNLLKKGIPVVISIEHKFTTSPTYGVVTRMRQQRSSYRHCDHVTCSSWQEVALTEFYVRDGLSKGKWQTACTYYTAAVIIQ